MEFQAFERGLFQAWRGRKSGLVVLHSPASTQVLARRLVQEYTREGVPTPEVDIVAWQQKAGQGQREHHWSSPAGLGLYLTVVRPLQHGPHLQMLPLLGPIALCRLLAPMTEGRCRIKWPNDLVIGDRKLGGLLIEVTSRGDDEAILAFGLGLNHGGVAEDYAAPSVITLSQTGGEAGKAPPDLVELARCVTDVLDTELATLTSHQPREVVELYARHSLHSAGDTLRCRVGDSEVEGTFEGFDDHGFLRLRVGEELRELSSGFLVGDP